MHCWAVKAASHKIDLIPVGMISDGGLISHLLFIHETGWPSQELRGPSQISDEWSRQRGPFQSSARLASQQTRTLILGAVPDMTDLIRLSLSCPEVITGERDAHLCDLAKSILDKMAPLVEDIGTQDWLTIHLNNTLLGSCRGNGSYGNEASSHPDTSYMLSYMLPSKSS